MNYNTELSLINTTNSSGTITLPASIDNQGRVILFKDIVGTFNTNTLTLQCDGADTFEDGGTVKVLKESYGSIQLVASDNKWYILNGTQVDSLQTVNFNVDAISSITISTINTTISSLTFIDNLNSTNSFYTTISSVSTQAVSTNFLYYNNFIIAGTRVGYSNIFRNSNFSPRSIQNLALWFDGADPFGNGTIPAQSTLMSNWTDKSNFKDDAFQRVVGNRPNYNTRGFMNFNGSNAFFNLSDISFVVNSAFSGFIVEQRQTANSANFILSGTASGLTNETLHFGYLASFIRFGFGGNDLNATAPVFTTVNTEPFRLWSFLYNNSGRFIYLNGTLQISDANRISLIATQGGLIGSNTFGLATPLYNGNISEIIFTKPSIDGFVRQQTEGYLAWKWGLQANLPASHPFKNAPPQ